jgi:hypothetical protein
MDRIGRFIALVFALILCPVPVGCQRADPPGPPPVLDLESARIALLQRFESMPGDFPGFGDPATREAFREALRNAEPVTRPQTLEKPAGVYGWDVTEPDGPKGLKGGVGVEMDLLQRRYSAVLFAPPVRTGGESSYRVIRILMGDFIYDPQNKRWQTSTPSRHDSES